MLIAALVAVALVGGRARSSVSTCSAANRNQPAQQRCLRTRWCRRRPYCCGPVDAGDQAVQPITDQSGVLGPLEYDAVNRALNKLYNGRGTRLWVVYVKNFGGLKPFRWAEDTMRANGFTDSDAILAIATDEPAFSFRVPNAVTNGKAIDVEIIRRDRIQPAVFRHEWARAAIAAANGLDVAPS